MTNKRTTFDAYRASHKRARIEKIRAAVKILANSSYSNVTRLATDVAKLVTELERAENERLPISERVEVKNVSRVTLLRNRDYRNILEATLHQQKGITPELESSISDYEALKIRCANLEVQNSILKERIRQFDFGINSVDSDGVLELKAVVETKKSDLEFVISFLDNMQQQVQRAFETVLPGEETEARPVPGFYGPRGLIASYDDMLKLKELRGD